MLVKDLFDDLPWSDTEVVDIELQKLLRQPLDVCGDGQRTERLLLVAHEKMPGQLELLVALYKMYAYTNRFDEALQRIDQVLEMAAARAGFDCDWRQLQPGSQWQDVSGASRLYLYSMKASGFVLLRKGDIEGALAVLLKLEQLDPLDQVGGSVVLEMAQRLLEAGQE